MSIKGNLWKDTPEKTSSSDTRPNHSPEEPLRKFESSAYVAVLGDKPTKLTIKRCPSTTLSSSLKEPIESIDERDDSIVRAANKRTATTCSNESKESCAESPDNADASSAPLSSTCAQNTSADSTTISATLANDKKRTADSDGTEAAKKSKASSGSQTVSSSLPTTTASLCTSTNAQPSSSRRNPMNAATASAILSFSSRSANIMQQMHQHNSKLKQEIPSMPSSSFIPPTVTAMPPLPPNWIDHYEDTIMSPFTHKTYPVNPLSMEYQTMESMVQPFQVIRINQIVNPDLWKRLVTTRKEMLRSKTDDLNLLSELGLDERDVMRCTHLALSETKHSLHPSYSDNMALLFHCTKSESSLQNILSQGLDERLCHVFGGRLGKGIYFADDVRKAVQYDGIGRILIFAVLLGDCISVDHFPFRNALVREPEKFHAREKRNPKDHFFDSIVGRPAGYNEYVIYDRYQCCPIYEIQYKRRATERCASTHLNFAVDSLPLFAWLPSDSTRYVEPKLCVNWPFRASELFEKMGAVSVQHNELIQCEIAPRFFVGMDNEQMPVDKKLATLFTFGFFDVERNQATLTKFNNDLFLTLNYLLENEGIPDTTVKGNEQSASLKVTTRQPTLTTKSQPLKNSNNQLPAEVTDFLLEFDANKSQSVKSPAMIECPICCNEFESFSTNPERWKVLKCYHKLCLACHSQMLTNRTTMSGVEQTFLKCPFCGDITGILIGTCPNIEMYVTTISKSCEGYESVNAISINYFVDADGHKLNRTAYLPNNAEGKEVLKLLRIAWDRRLSFTVGDSVTTGQKNVLVWGIHHKTALCGGVLLYGYPDPGYMNRVKMELKSFGIE